MGAIVFLCEVRPVSYTHLWINGYKKRYGLVRVDYEKGLKRIPKKSYYWYKQFIEEHQDL